MAAYKIIVPLIALMFIAATVWFQRTGRISMLQTIFLSLIWISIGAIALFPDYISVNLAKIFGIKSNINALLFISLGVLFLLFLRLSFQLESQNKRITELVRKLALEEDSKKRL